jgi:TPR repeat protein
MSEFLISIIPIFIIGLAFVFGNYISSLRKDLSEIDQLVLSAGEKNTRIMIDIGFKYEMSNLGKPLKYEKAKFWYYKAANLGNEHAMYDLYKILFYKLKSDNFKKGEAIDWLIESAEKDCWAAQRELSQLYENGDFLEKSEEKSKFWKEKYDSNFKKSSR